MVMLYFSISIHLIKYFLYICVKSQTIAIHFVLNFILERGEAFFLSFLGTFYVSFLPSAVMY